MVLSAVSRMTERVILWENLLTCRSSSLRARPCRSSKYDSLYIHCLIFFYSYYQLAVSRLAGVAYTYQAMKFVGHEDFGGEAGAICQRQ
jgi:hypothetical protein